MTTFHDKNYDGIVLNIPTWFIEMNNLQGSLDEFRSALEKCALSMHHPDHIRNIYELENYKSKQERLHQQLAEQKKRKEEQLSRQSKILSREIKPLEWKRCSMILEREIITIGGVDFGFNDVFTKKLGVKTSFTKAFFENIKTLEGLKEFVSNSQCMNGYLLEDISSECIDMSGITFMCSNHYPVLQMNIDVLMVWTNVDFRNGSYHYRRDFLKMENGIFYLKKGNDRDVFDGFVKRGMELIKQ